mgnify:CR=1 FL=1
MNNRFEQIVNELHAIEKDLTERGALLDDIEVHTFEQVWSSTALGFGGLGGQAITRANTYVIITFDEHTTCYVYFSSGFAYSMPYNSKVFEDIKNRNMAPVRERGKYLYE